MEVSPSRVKPETVAFPHFFPRKGTPPMQRRCPLLPLLLVFALALLAACSTVRADQWAATDPGAVPGLPPRAADAPTGTAFIQQVRTMTFFQREAAILAQLRAGNVPTSLRRFQPVEYTAPDANGVQRNVRLLVLPDYLGIGSDEDWVRMPMSPATAQTFCNEHRMFLPTRAISNRVWTASDEKLAPQPMTENREHPDTFLEHHNLIEGARADGVGPESIIAGIKKDVVISNRLLEQSNRVAIFGWHYQNGTPIQPLSIVHHETYVDYSQGSRPLFATMYIDGAPHNFEDVATDAILHPLVSDEGVLQVVRYGS